MPRIRPLLTESSSPCAPILKDGLYEYLNVRKTADFAQDMKSYFASDTFKSDFRAEKWGAKLNVIVDGAPIGLDAGASDQEITQFQQRIVAANSLSISQASYDEIVSRIPNVEMAREYTKCVMATRNFGFVVLDENVTENLVVLKVGYRKRISDDPMPVARKASVRGGSNVEGLPNEGDEIEDEFVVAFTRSADTDAVVSISTTREAFTWAIPASFKLSEAIAVPVGAVVASTLNWQQFRLACRDDRVAGQQWSSFKSKWCPCDGRPIPGSSYEKIAMRVNAPDFRGVFLRALNVLDPAPPAPLPALPPNRIDPHNRGVESFQPDGLKEHDHPLEGGEFGTSVVHGQDRYEGGTDWDRILPDSRRISIRVGPVGGSETRPRNVAVFYYVRIN